MAASPFSFAGALSYPPDAGVAPQDIPVNFAGSFENEAKFTLKLVGAGSQVVDFGTITPNGAKVLFIEYDADPSPAAQPVQLNFNSGTDDLELTPGSFFVYGNNAPTVAGLLSLSITHAANAVVRITILG